MLYFLWKNSKEDKCVRESLYDSMCLLVLSRGLVNEHGQRGCGQLNIVCQRAKQRLTVRQHSPAEAALKPDHTSGIKERFSILWFWWPKNRSGFVKGNTKPHGSSLNGTARSVIYILTI